MQAASCSPLMACSPAPKAQRSSSPASPGRSSTAPSPTKELIAGFSILQVKSLEEAIEWVKRGPTCSADDYEVEIRQMFEMEDFAPILTEEELQHKERLRAQLPNQTAKD